MGELKTIGEITAFVKPSRCLTEFISYIKIFPAVSGSSPSDYVAESDLSAPHEANKTSKGEGDMVGSDRVLTLLN